MSAKPRVTRRNACEGKMRYSSRKEAKRTRQRVNVTGHLSIYRCPFCGFYHLGHLAKSVISGDLGRDEWRGEAR